MPKRSKFNRLNFSYFFSVSFLALLSFFVFIITPFFTSTISKREPQQLPEEPETFIQIEKSEFPPNFFQEIKFGQTKTGEINLQDFSNPFSDGGHVDGYYFVLPELDNYDDVEVYFRSCPHDGGDNYDSCQAFSSFIEKIYILNSKWEKISEMDTRIDFDSFPITDDKTYYLLVGTDSYSANKTGYYKITFDYETSPVKFKVKFRGIDKNGGELKARLKLYQNPWVFADKIYEIGEVSLKADDQGVYQGEFSLGARHFDFKDYTLLVKGPKHLQGRFPDLSFVKNQTLYLNYKPLEPGDLALPQDGKADSQDFNYLWDNRGSTDPNKLAVGDLNLDGAINMGDLNLLLETLQTKYDEEGW